MFPPLPFPPLPFPPPLAGLCKESPEYNLAVLQRSINEKSLQTLKEYYRTMRMYRLSKEHLPDDPEAQKTAIHQVCVQCLSPRIPV